LMVSRRGVAGLDGLTAEFYPEREMGWSGSQEFEVRVELTKHFLSSFRGDLNNIVKVDR
jgi:hypothetical protein